MLKKIGGRAYYWKLGWPCDFDQYKVVEVSLCQF